MSAAVTTGSDPHRIVIVGGGAGGLELATRLGRRLGRHRRAWITLLDRERTHIWKPLLHEVASGTIDRYAEAVPYMAQARWRHFRYRIGAMDGLDRKARRIFVAPSFDEDGAQVTPRHVIEYDTLVIAVGSVANYYETPGAAEHAIALDTEEQAARFHRRMVNACLRANAQTEALRPGQLHCVIVGAGATGVELAAELHRSMRELAAFGLDRIDFDASIKLTIVEAGPRILPALPERLSQAATDLLTGLDVVVCGGTSVIGPAPEGRASPPLPPRGSASTAASSLPPSSSSGRRGSRRRIFSLASTASRATASTGWSSARRCKRRETTTFSPAATAPPASCRAPWRRCRRVPRRRIRRRRCSFAR
jgi:NADH:ubiquinone reductase (H+-translocating)